jgi:primase-polymerase (primpol)-like protein
MDGVTPKPIPLTPKPEAIPAELKLLRAWVTWRYELRDGVWTKVPYQTDGLRRAKPNDPSTWGSFDSAIERYPRGVGGVGFMLSKEHGYVGVDLDHCVGERTEPWALAIIFALNTYTELSPSGTGLRILLKGNLPVHGRRKSDIEMYDSGRYLTVTGHHRAGSPQTIENRAEEIQALHKRVFTEPKVISRPHRETSITLNDSDLLEKAFRARNGAKIKSLYDGLISNYPSRSEADLALCSGLAFYTSDPAQLDRLFRSSGLFREKWDERRFADGRTYGEGTISKVIEQ